MHVNLVESYAIFDILICIKMQRQVLKQNWKATLLLNIQGDHLNKMKLNSIK